MSMMPPLKKISVNRSRLPDLRFLQKMHAQILNADQSTATELKISEIKLEWNISDFRKTSKDHYVAAPPFRNVSDLLHL